MTIIRELTYKISPGLVRALLAVCPSFHEAIKRARLAIESIEDIADLAEEFDLVAYLSVENDLEDHEKPIFRLDDHLDLFFNNTKWMTHEEETRARYSQASRLAQNVIDEMKREDKLPTRIDYDDKIVVLRHIKGAAKYYCLPDEAKELKLEAMRSFEESQEF